MVQRIWHSQPLENIVYDAVRDLSKGGSAPVRDAELLAHLKNRRVDLSRIDLVRVLIVLETLGYVRTFSSGDEIDIRLLK